MVMCHQKTLSVDLFFVTSDLIKLKHNLHIIPSQDNKIHQV